MVGACWPLAMVEQLELVGPNATLRTKFTKMMRYRPTASMQPLRGAATGRRQTDDLGKIMGEMIHLYDDAFELKGGVVRAYGRVRCARKKLQIKNNFFLDVTADAFVHCHVGSAGFRIRQLLITHHPESRWRTR